MVIAIIYYLGLPLLIAALCAFGPHDDEEWRKY